jgi:molecular chaperone DnaK
VSAKDLGTGNEQQIRIEGGSGLSEDEVGRMISEAESHAGEAHRLREQADARNAAEQLAYQVERTLAEHRDKLPEGEASTIEGRIMELRQATEAGDVNDIQAKTSALEEASRGLADAIYAQASAAQAGSAQASGNGDGAVDDEIVEDADFEVIDEEEATKS